MSRAEKAGNRDGTAKSEAEKEVNHGRIQHF